jgi:S-DNA-T family DNA segregation ATPase FtsK/SpoIIIE
VFVPNKERTIVRFRDTITNVAAYMQEEPKDKHVPIPLNFGIDSNGDPFVDDLTMQPHLLVAGTTGSGKSTGLHCLVTSMLWVMNPDELRVLISDTKGVEFKAFAHVPHLQPINNEPGKICTSVFDTMAALDWCVNEAQRRMDEISKADVRNIHEYNKIKLQSKMPYVVLVIDELNDILGPALDRPVAQANSAKLGTIVGRARASGIHVIASTQRPDVRLIRGNIKANFSTRLSFRLPSHQDSRTVLNTKGAENLLSRGDMLYQSSMSSELKRLHAPLTTLEDVKLMVGMIIQREEQRKEELLEKKVFAVDRERTSVN